MSTIIDLSLAGRLIIHTRGNSYVCLPWNYVHAFILSMLNYYLQNRRPDQSQYNRKSFPSPNVKEFGWLLHQLFTALRVRCCHHRQSTNILSSSSIHKNKSLLSISQSNSSNKHFADMAIKRNDQLRIPWYWRREAYHSPHYWSRTSKSSHGSPRNFSPPNGLWYCRESLCWA